MTEIEIETDIPRWAPLERFVLDEEKLGDWMWMQGFVIDGERRIEAYKHSDTREHLFLDKDGNTVSSKEINRLGCARPVARFGETRSEVADFKATDKFVEAIRESDLEALNDVLGFEDFLYVDVSGDTIERGAIRFMERLSRRTFGPDPIARWGGDHRVAVVEMSYIELGSTKLSVMVLEMIHGRVASATEYVMPLEGAEPRWWEHTKTMCLMHFPDELC